MVSKLNINETVKVKLTDFGVDILRRRHDELNTKIISNGGTGLDEFSLKIDEEGYTKFQLWNLMQIFGPYMSMGLKMPFEMEIII